MLVSLESVIVAHTNEGKYKVIINKAAKGWSETFATTVANDPALALFRAIQEVIDA